MPKILYDLASGMVLDRSQFVNLPPIDMTQIISSIRAAGHKPLCIVDSADKFFTPKTLVAFMAANDKNYKLINEELNFFTPAQVEALMGDNINVVALAEPVQPQLEPFGAPVAENLEGAVGALNGPLNGYPFAVIPDGWSVGSHISLGPTKIKRKQKSPQGDGAMFYMAPGDMESLWLFSCSKAWAGFDVPLTTWCMTGYGKKKATVQDDCVLIGGDYIRRYELEQIAKYRNWAFPQQEAQAA